jgi:hypothetical protein
MPEPINPPPSPTRDDCIRHGRLIGGLVALGLTIVPICLGTLLGNVNANLIQRIIMGFGVSLMPDLLAVLVGLYLGEMAAKCRTINIAFVRGAFYTGLAVVVLVLPFIWFNLSYLNVQSSRVWFGLLCFFAPMPAAGSLASGVAAIYVRDYWEFRRKRWIPQFTLKQLFIIFTIASIMISSMTSLATLR